MSRRGRGGRKSRWQLHLFAGHHDRVSSGSGDAVHATMALLLKLFYSQRVNIIFFCL